MYNCHCRMCQKVHGAAFGTYAFVKDDQFQWTTDTESVVGYNSSDILIRNSCKTCGSVVPFESQKPDQWVVPAGCHDTMRTPDHNIFMPDNAPWHTVSGDLPECEFYPDDSGRKPVDGLPDVGEATLPEKPMQGSCLCGKINFQVTEPLKLARNCHCSRCRQGRSTAHACNGFVSYDGVDFLAGEEHLQNYKVPDAQFFTQVFCKNCSSLMPRKDSGRGISIIPMGSLDNDPGIKTSDHIWVGDKSSWHNITDGLPQHEAGPPA